MLGILEKISPSEFVSNGYISNHNKVRRPRPKFKVSFFIYFCCFWINVTQINFENIKKRYKESFLIIISSWNRDLLLMLECSLSHYWTSPLSALSTYSHYSRLGLLSFRIFFVDMPVLNLQTVDNCLQNNNVQISTLKK